MKASSFLLKRKLLLICAISFLFSIYTASAVCNLQIHKKVSPNSWDTFFCESGTTTLEVDTTGTGKLLGTTLNVIWEQRIDGQSDFTVIPNQENPLKQILTINKSTIFYVYVQIKDVLGNVLCEDYLIHYISVLRSESFHYDMCFNASVSLGGDANLGNSWEWLDGDRNVIVPESSDINKRNLQDLSPTDTTTYYFVVHNGSCTAEQANVVNVIPFIEFTTNPPSVVACKGDVVNIVPTSTVPTTGVSYTWSMDGANGVIANEFTLPTEVAKNGDVYVTPSAMGYCGRPDRIPYSVTDLIITPYNWPTSFSPDDDIFLAMNISQKGHLPISMEWYENSYAQGISNSSGTFSPSQTSTYTFEISTAVCHASYSQQITMAFPDAIESVEVTDFSIDLYPNPAIELTNLKLTGVNGDTKISIINLSGKEYFTSVEESENGKIEKTLDVSALVQGVYLLKVECNGVEKTQLFMKK